MPRRESEEVVRKHIWVYSRDWERIEAYFGDNIRASKAIRTIIRSYLNRIEASALAKAQAEKVELHLELGEEELNS